MMAGTIEARATFEFACGGDIGTIAMIQGVGYSIRESGSLQLVSEP
jgi:hypothetical protein